MVDVNGDGRLDLIVLSTTGTSSNLVWLRGKGDGSYAAPATIASLSSKYSYAFVVGDFNRDSRPDIALSSSAKILTIYINNGSGYFTAHPYAFSSTVARVADVNHDGNLDLSSNTASGGISVSLGDGTGHFGKEIDTLVPSFGNPVTVAAVADYNRDGHLDVIVETDSYNGIYQVLFGKGDGTFRQGPIFGEGQGWVGSITTADVNGDGIPDLLVANSSNNNGAGFVGFCGSGSVQVALGNGDGTFSRPMSYTAGYLPEYITTADLNNDGRPDILVANASSNSVSVLYNLGGGKFSAAHSYTTGTYPPAVYVGDLNHDGKLDLVLLQPGGVRVFLAAGSSYRAPQGLEIGDPPQLLVATDFNHDGIYDLAIRTYNTYGACRSGGILQLSITLSAANLPASFQL